MRILVTGGAGYIGSATTRALVEGGHTVTVLDTLENGHRESVCCGARFVQGSVGDDALLATILPDIDVVMHLAGYIEVAESVKNPEKYHHNNLENAAIMLQAMEEAGVGALVFSSTAAVYGQPECIPIVEDAALAPINPYGQSKLDFENLLDAAARTWGLRSVRFRYFNVAGAWPDASIGEAHNPETHIIPRFLSSFINHEPITIFGNDYPTEDGTCVRDYIHVCDLARAHVMAIEALAAGEEGGIYNLGNGQGFSNGHIARAAAHACGIADDDVAGLIKMGPRRPGDPATLVASAARAYERFGWKPAFPKVETMIEHALMWHRAHPHGYENE